MPCLEHIYPMLTFVAGTPIVGVWHRLGRRGPMSGVHGCSLVPNEQESVVLLPELDDLPHLR